MFVDFFIGFEVDGGVLVVKVDVVWFGIVVCGFVLNKLFLFLMGVVLGILLLLDCGGLGVWLWFLCMLGVFYGFFG